MFCFGNDLKKTPWDVSFGGSYVKHHLFRCSILGGWFVTGCFTWDGFMKHLLEVFHLGSFVRTPCQLFHFGGVVLQNNPRRCFCFWGGFMEHPRCVLFLGWFCETPLRAFHLGG